MEQALDEMRIWSMEGDFQQIILFHDQMNSRFSILIVYILLNYVNEFQHSLHFVLSVRYQPKGLLCQVQEFRRRYFLLRMAALAQLKAAESRRLRMDLESILESLSENVPLLCHSILNSK